MTDTTTATEERIEITDCGSDVCEWLNLHGAKVTTTAVAAGGSLAAHPGRLVSRQVTTTPWQPVQGELFA